MDIWEGLGGKFLSASFSPTYLKQTRRYGEYGLRCYFIPFLQQVCYCPKLEDCLWRSCSLLGVVTLEEKGHFSSLAIPNVMLTVLGALSLHNTGEIRLTSCRCCYWFRHFLSRYVWLRPLLDGSYKLVRHYPQLTYYWSSYLVPRPTSSYSQNRWGNRYEPSNEVYGGTD